MIFNDLIIIKIKQTTIVLSKFNIDFIDYYIKKEYSKKRKVLVINNPLYQY
jgi:hypothetical protein